MLKRILIVASLCFSNYLLVCGGLFLLYMMIRELSLYLYGYIKKKVIHITIYSKEKGKQEFTQEEWWEFDGSAVTFHREDDKPAVEMSTGYKAWYRKGKLHRINNKPGVEYSGGEKSYCIEDEYYTYEDYKAIIEEVNNMQPALRLTDPREWVREL